MEHAMQSQNCLIRMIIDENPVDKRSLERPRLKWEDGLRKDVEALNREQDWKARAIDREG